MKRTITKPGSPNFYHQLMSVEIENQNWFIADDVTTILELQDPVEVIDTLEDEERFTTTIFKDGKEQSVNLVSESGLYALIFKSDTERAKKFRKWVTGQVLPLIRVRGYYTTKRLEIPNFVLRFNDNWDRVDKGYFSVLSELFIRLYGRFEKEGYHLPNKAFTGKDMRPDISVALHFDKFLEENHPQLAGDYKMYPHRLPSGQEIEVKQYKNRLLPIFIEFVDEKWIPDHAFPYFEKRDKKALAYLPKLVKK